MLSSLLMTAIKCAVATLLSQALQREIMKYWNKVKVVVLALLVKYPQLLPWAASALAGAVANWGLHVSASMLLGVLLAVEGLLRGATVTAQKKAAKPAK